jgi:sugar phosphate isomerase/epimerase
MECTRREFGKIALAAGPTVALFEKVLAGSALIQAKPNSLFNGVQIGAITYSYRSMPDQSAEATLKYIVDSGISAVELMGGPVESFAGAPAGGRAGGGGRGPGGAPGAAGAGAPPALPAGGGRGGAPCIPGQGPAADAGGGRGRGGPGGAPGAPADAAAGGRGGGRGTAVPNPDQPPVENPMKAWRTSVSMDKFRALRKMYNDAGVQIYAWKQLSPNMSDEEFEYIFNVAEALGCTHTTLELTDDEAQLRRIGEFAMKKKIYAAYHTHTQGSMTAFDKAFAVSKGNMANVDFGHYVAAGNVGGTSMQFLEKFHDRIASFHLKDRTTPVNCAQNLAWGAGDTPIKEILQMVKKNRWKIPASIELEYAVPQGSDAVKEVLKCVQYCKAALA